MITFSFVAAPFCLPYYVDSRNELSKSFSLPTVSGILLYALLRILRQTITAYPKNNMREKIENQGKTITEQQGTITEQQKIIAEQKAALEAKEAEIKRLLENRNHA